MKQEQIQRINGSTATKRLKPDIACKK